MYGISEIQRQTPFAKQPDAYVAKAIAAEFERNILKSRGTLPRASQKRRFVPGLTTTFWPTMCAQFLGTTNDSPTTQLSY